MLLALAALTVVASSQKPGVPPAPSRVPEQIHTAVAGQSSTSGDATGFSVMWFTSERTDSVVRFSTSPDLDSAAPVEVRGTSESYLEDWGYHHTVEVLGLRPSVVYYYAVGDGASTWSATQRYRMTPGAASTEPFNMSIFGDMGYLGSEERPMVITIVGLKKHWSAVPTRRRLEHMHSAGELDAIWHVGDIGYIDDSFAHEGGQLHFVYEQAYNGYMSWLQNLTATMPYMVSPGNHESECHIDQCLLQSEKYGKKLNNFTAFNKRWHMPSATSGGALNMW
jgi:phosphodiesterase/alkaline phosphatase D-like protein